MSEKPFSEACERNREPILSVLEDVFAKVRCVLEIGSGTGQHAVYFGARMPYLAWQPTELPEARAGIQAWLDDEGPANVRRPLVLDVSSDNWPGIQPDAAFSANTAHIMPWEAVCDMFLGLGRRLPPGAPFCLYGPFNYHGRHTSESNDRFDADLRQRDPAMGIRDIDDLKELAARAGFELAADHEMPANNRTLVWRRTAEG